MNARHFLLVGALVVGLALLGWFFLSEGGSSERRELHAERAAAEPEAPADVIPAATLDSPTIATADAGLGTDAGDTRTAVEAEPAERRTWDEAETVWLEVQVGTPEGATPGDEVVVVALEDSDDYSAVYDDDGPLAEIRAGEDPLSIRDVYAGAVTTLGGTARLALPPDAEELWIWVGGDYAYVREGVEVTRASFGEPVQVTPLQGAMITGRVVPPAGSNESIEGIEIDLNWSMNSMLQLGGAGRVNLDLEANTDANGQFAFRGVAVGGPQMAATEESAFAQTFHDDFEPAVGEHLELELALTKGCTVRGRVVDESGAPIAGCEVEALGREFFGNPTSDLREGKTDADGRFDLAAVTSGKVWIHVEHDDYQELLTDSWEVTEGEDRDLGDLVLNEGNKLAGTVTFPDGEPAMGAIVSVDPDLSNNMMGTPVNPRVYIGADGTAKVGEDGSFTLTGLGEGPWNVTADLRIGPTQVVVDQSGMDDEVAAEVTEEILESIPPVEDLLQLPGVDSRLLGRAIGRWTANEGAVTAPREDLAFVLEEPVNLAGVVRGADETPVTDFEIHAELAGTQWFMPPSETEEDQFEAEDGRFLLTGLRAGKWTVWAEAEGYARSEELSIELPSDEEAVFALELAVVLAGRVLDPDGAVVPGAEVAQQLEGTQFIEAMQGRSDWPSTSSDETGVFELQGMPPGAGSIVAKHDGFAPSEPFAYDLAEGGEERDIVLQLRRGGTISGLVYDAEGGPAKNCVVILQIPTMEDRRMTNADENGEFLEEGLTPGSWQVQAFPGLESFTPEGGESLNQAELMKSLKMATVELENEQSEHVVLGAPPADPVALRGRITVDGEAVAESIVSFVPATAAGMEALKISNTDEDGVYELTVDEPGDYLVTVQTMSGPGRQNSVEMRREVPKAEEHVLDIALPVGRVTGRVTDSDGDAVAGARVTLTMQSGQVFGTVFGGQYNELVTDDDGRYEIEYLRPGSYVVAAGGTFLGGLLGDDGNQTGRVLRTVDVAEGQWVEDFDFRLAKPGEIHGTVRDLAGKPVEGAAIFLRDEEGRLVELFSFLTTGATGTFEYEGLAPGEYTVTARTDELSSADGELLRVRAGETTETTVTVDTGTMLLVTLIDKGGEDVVSSVSVVDAQGREMAGMLSLVELMNAYDGGLGQAERKVGPLAAGSYEVRCTTADGRSVKKRVKLSGRPERKVKLRLR